MLNQIELYRSIPETRKTIQGFIEETKLRLSDHQSYALKMKYNRRLDLAQKALFAINQLHGALNE